MPTVTVLTCGMLRPQLFMRATVLVTDVLYIAAAYLFMRRCTPLNWASQTAALLVLLSQPALLLIDHGHFQYNSFSLGLVLASVVAVHHGELVVHACGTGVCTHHAHRAPMLGDMRGRS